MSEENPNSITITLRDDGLFDLYNYHVGAITTVSDMKLEEALWVMVSKIRVDQQVRRIPEILRRLPTAAEAAQNIKDNMA